MAWATPRTWAVGDYVDAATMNAQVRDNFAYLKGTSGVIYLESPTELAESAVPATPASGRGRIYVGNAGLNNGIASSVSDAGVVYQMVRYAEGTFTPTYLGTTIPGTTTYTQQTGEYLRVGNLVNFWIRMSWTATTATGLGLVGGLPFASGIVAQPTGIVFSSNYAFAGNGMLWNLGTGGTTLSLWQLTTGGFTQQAIDTAADVIISGSYKV